jgi:hypothetical protein
MRLMPPVDHGTALLANRIVRSRVLSLKMLSPSTIMEESD